MAKVKIKELGVVKKVHSSGIVETNQGIKSMIKANIGDRLIEDIATKVVSIASKKTNNKSGNTKNKIDEETQTTVDEDNSIGLMKGYEA